MKLAFLITINNLIEATIAQMDPIVESIILLNKTDYALLDDEKDLSDDEFNLVLYITIPILVLLILVLAYAIAGSCQKQKEAQTDDDERESTTVDTAETNLNVSLRGKPVETLIKEWQQKGLILPKQYTV